MNTIFNTFSSYVVLIILSMSNRPKRITVFKQNTDGDGRLFLVPDSIPKLITQVGRKLSVNVDRLFTEYGALVDEVDVIVDGDILFAYESGMQFPTKEISKCSCDGKKDIKSEEKPTVAKTNSDWLKLNVGGAYFMTTRSTLVSQAPESMLARMFSSEEDQTWSSSLDSGGAFLIDRSPHYFEPILNYLRYGELVLDKHVNAQGVLEEARFFGIESLIEILEIKVKNDEPLTDASPFTRREFVSVLMSTPYNSILRCQGVNFSGINLSKLDLRNINFKYAIFKGANLTGANLTECNFERADLSNCKLDGANMLGVRMLCVNLEGSSMKGCNFEDPAGTVVLILIH